MNANPLIPQQADSKPAQTESPSHVVYLVTNSPPKDIEGIGGFLSAFNQGDVKAEVIQFRHVIQRKARRSIGGKFSQGLTHEVIENIEINPNQDLFGLRRWMGQIRSEPSNILLLNVPKVKEDAIAAPLIFSEMLRTGRPILVAGLDNSGKDQLLSPVDLQFQTIPAPIAQNRSLKLMLLARVQRRKGFASSIRSLMDLDFLPKPVQEKVNTIATGGDPGGLSEEEMVNLAILSDLASRYDAVLSYFKTTLQNASVQVPLIMAMFELLMADLSVEVGMEVYKEFLQDAVETDAEISNKGQLFGHIYRYLGKRDDARDKTKRMGHFLRTLTNVFLRRRSQVDPMLWKRCYFLSPPHPDELPMLNSLRPYRDQLNQWIKAGAQKAGEEVQKTTAKQIMDLAHIANRKPESMKEESEYVQQRLANVLLAHFRTDKFNTLRFVNSGKPVEGLEERSQAFMESYCKTPITTSDLQRIRTKLTAVLDPDKVLTEAIRKSVLEVMVRHARQKDETLREIYILNSVKSLVKFPFHIGTKGLSSIEQKCSLDLVPSRLGLEFHPHAVTDYSIGLFAEDENPRLGEIKNDALTLCRAYAELVGLRVERIVKKALDHKINYYIKTYGENFFGVVFERVVRLNDIPMSQGQLAEILKARNVLGSLDTKGWKAAEETGLADPLLAIGLQRPDRSKPVEIPKDLSDFRVEYTDSYAQFRVLLLELKASSEEDKRENNPKKVIWSLYRQGIYNLYCDEAKAVFRKTIYFKYFQELIANISSKNYSIFHREGTAEGVKIFIPRNYAHILVVGDRFSFLDSDTVVKYQLMASPAEDLDKLDDLSRVFVENLDQQFHQEDKEDWVVDLEALMAEIQRSNVIWNRYSRNLTLALLDRVISETVIKDMAPGKVLSDNLYYMPDHTKLCLGKAVVGNEAAPFAKILQRPELIGNITKNPNAAATTIDDFAIEVHKIERVWEEMRMYVGVAEDVVDIVQGLSHDRAEMGAALDYEKHIKMIIALLSKPVRDFTEHDVQALHTVASKIRMILQNLYNSPSAAKQKITNRLQSQLTSRRSDSHNCKLNFTDNFLLAKEQVAIRKVVQKGDKRVTVRKKVEIEIDPTHQTLPMRIREVIRVQGIIGKKDYLVMSPEGQKKKQTDYALEIIDTMLTMRGNGITIFVDHSMLEESQVHRLATRVKPHNFFDMNALKPEPLPGMKVSGKMNPLTGLPMSPVVEQVAPPENSVAPAEEPKETIFRSPKDSGLVYRYDREQDAYFYGEGDAEVRANVFPVKLGKSARSIILMVKQSNARPLFHGIYGNEILLPTEERPDPPTICTFQFFDQTVRIVNEGGKPTVKVEQETSPFLDELRSV